MTVARAVARAVASPVARAVGAGIGGGLTLSQVVADAVGYWPLQDDAANTVVTNNNGADGVLAGGGNTQDLSTDGPGGSYLKALSFNGTNYITTGITEELTSFSVSVWAKNSAATSPSYRHMMAKGNVFKGSSFEFALGWRNNTTSGDQVWLFFHDGTALRSTLDSQNPAYNVNDWNHYLITVVDGTQVLFVNGALMATASLSIGSGTSIQITIGRGDANDSSSAAWIGSLAGAAVFTRVLNAEEISVLANAGV